MVSQATKENRNKLMYDKICPKCGCKESKVWGHFLLDKDRVCQGCSFIYNRGKEK